MMKTALLLLSLLSSADSLESSALKTSASRIADTIKHEMERSVALLETVWAIAGKGELEGEFPAPHRRIEQELRKLFDSDEGNAGVFSVYYAREDGTMSGVQNSNSEYQVVIGTAPSNPSLECANPKKRSTCRSPEGTVPGELQFYNVVNDPLKWELDEQEHKLPYDPRTKSWYAAESSSPSWFAPYVYRVSDYTSGIAVTIAKSVESSDGKKIGVVAVDVSLSGLHMILGINRPAPGSEVVLADPSSATVIASTMAASSLIKLTHEKMSCFESPFVQIFSPLSHNLGGLQRAARIGPALLRADKLLGSLIRWDAIQSYPIPIRGGLTWLLVVTDDSEYRHSSPGSVVDCSWASLLMLLLITVLLN
eukprot:TRINITY_DN3851_c0_g1_i1.p1 TRINITY_DN3851_c0_g1~~TRINITY_DN3851_c0_g1_i1.p1  ORF type:complete len:391 (+),score=74.99 TRINITY_DN3851_c0_g1_i1:78-1175(+)